jgi:hypothetical protein
MENITFSKNNCDLVFEIHKNVKTQTCNIFTSEIFYEYYDSIQEDSSISYFLLLETCFDGAFGHWIYESAIYLPYFFELKSYYPELKILLKKNPKKSYKNLFLKAFNINENDIYWIDNTDYDNCTINYSHIPNNNICINPQYQYLNTVQFKNATNFKNLVINFKNTIINNLNIIYPEKKTIEYLFFARSKLENYTPNDRTVDYTNIYKLLEGKEYIEYDTINTKNLKNQIELLISSQNIYIDCGSAFLVNFLFCKNSNINIINFLDFCKKYEPWPTLMEINNNNSIIML